MAAVTPGELRRCVTQQNQEEGHDDEP
jgi:hypothetical protein